MAERPRRSAEALAAAGLIGSTFTGCTALFLAMVAFSSSEFVAAGVALLAAGVAFGLLANACLRQ
jgi:hypothetical protein